MWKSTIGKLLFAFSFFNQISETRGVLFLYLYLSFLEPLLKLLEDAFNIKIHFEVSTNLNLIKVRPKSINRLNNMKNKFTQSMWELNLLLIFLLTFCVCSKRCQVIEWETREGQSKHSRIKMFIFFMLSISIYERYRKCIDHFCFTNEKIRALRKRDRKLYVT